MDLEVPCEIAIDDLHSLVALLEQHHLDASDITPEDLREFVGIKRGAQLVAAGALQNVSGHGWLRSIVTADSARGQGFAGAIVDQLEATAAKQGVSRVYLLTDTATDYFQRRGYRKIDRSEAPPAIAEVPQFASLCPDSADFMRKTLLS